MCAICDDPWVVSDDQMSCVACNDPTDGVTDCTECYNQGTDIRCSECTGTKRAVLGGTQCVEMVDGCERYQLNGSNELMEECAECSEERVLFTDDDLACPLCDDVATTGVADCATCTYDGTDYTCTSCTGDKRLVNGGIECVDPVDMCTEYDFDSADCL